MLAHFLLLQRVPGVRAALHLRLCFFFFSDALKAYHHFTTLYSLLLQPVQPLGDPNSWLSTCSHVCSLLNVFQGRKRWDLSGKRKKKGACQLW